MYRLILTNQYKRDYKRLKKRGFNLSELDSVLLKLMQAQPLEPRYQDHALSGDYFGFRECHIRPDWLLIYSIDKGALILTASRTGTHSDLL
jgi:mRNA interferase YafQ